MIEYAGHLGSWNGSLLLAAAGYEMRATPARKPLGGRLWRSAQRGRTGSGGFHRADYPFSETRDYVQRVLENTEVYRDRLAGKDLPPADPERPLYASRRRRARPWC